MFIHGSIYVCVIIPGNTCIPSKPETCHDNDTYNSDD